ncbi:MAG: DUF2948 family protein [Bauldia sp.]
MPATPLLKLVALDEDDLAIISAHVQDALLKIKDLTFRPAEKRFAIGLNRFAWELVAGATRKPDAQRHRAVLHFDRVLSVKAHSVPQDRPEGILSLLAVEFEKDAEPAGTIRLIFAGGAEIRLDVEVIEAQLADLGPAWQTKAVPAHELADQPMAASDLKPK